MLGTVFVVVMTLMLFAPLSTWAHRRQCEVLERDAVNRSGKISTSVCNTVKYKKFRKPDEGRIP